MKSVAATSAVFALLATVGQHASFAAPPSRRPHVDLQAMEEAMSASPTSDGQYPSAASYAHFLQARLAHHDGEHRRALDELRLSLASDDQSAYLLTQLAEQYARMSDLERAESQLKRVLELAPDYAPAQLLMGRVLYESQKVTRAKTHLGRAIKLRPHDPDAYLVLTQLWLDQGKIDDAIKVIEELGAALPGEPIGYRRLGLALAERGETSRAEKLLLRAVDRDPGDVDAWTTLAQIYDSTNRSPKALEAYSRALERDSENRELLLSAGRLALRLDNLTEARAYFDQLLSLSRDPEQVVKVAFSYLAVRRLTQAAEVLDAARKQTDEPRLHFYAGLVYERTRNFQKGLDAFSSVPVSHTELGAEAKLHRAMCLSALGQHKAALEQFKKLSDENDSVSGLDLAWARALERAGQAKESEVLLFRAFAVRPTPEVLDALNLFYSRQGRIGEAVAFLSNNLAKRPRDEAILFALAAALDRKGDWQKAIERMRQVLDVNPENIGAMNFIGYTLAERGGDLDEAERFVLRALQSRPDSPSFLDSYGWVLFKKGDIERSVEQLEHAVAAAPDDPTLLEHLGDVYARATKRAKALDAYRRAIDALGDNPEEAVRPNQRADLERKLKAINAEASR